MNRIVGTSDVMDTSGHDEAGETGDGESEQGLGWRTYLASTSFWTRILEEGPNEVALERVSSSWTRVEENRQRKGIEGYIEG